MVAGPGRTCLRWNAKFVPPSQISLGFLPRSSMEGIQLDTVAARKKKRPAPTGPPTRHLISHLADVRGLGERGLNFSSGHGPSTNFIHYAFIKLVLGSEKNLEENFLAGEILRPHKYKPRAPKTSSSSLPGSTFLA